MNRWPPAEWSAIVRHEAHRLAKRAADIEDLTQEALIALSTLVEDTPLGFVRNKARWAMTDYVRNTLPLSRTHYREVGRDRAQELTNACELPADAVLDGREPSALEWFELSERLGSLSKREAEVLELLTGMTQAEAAQRLGLTEGAIAHVAHRIRRKLGGIE